MNTQTEIFRRLVRDHMGPPPALLDASSTVADAVQGMRQERVSSALVLDRDRTILGILTEQDVVRRIAFQTDAAAPASSVMTEPVVTLERNEYLFHAVAIMRRLGLRHIPVVDEARAVVGMLSLHEALTALSEATLALVEKLTHEESEEGLRAVKKAQVELALALFGDGVPVPEVQTLLSDINRDIHGRVLRRELDRMKEDGWGDPPVRFSLIILGSGGRGENFLFPDQDNGFIVDHYEDDAHDRIDPFFVKLAERMTRRLDRIGFPLCKGNVMATNPVWRKRLDEWRAQIGYWIDRRTENVLRHTDIFFDFTHAWGAADLSTALRDSVTEAVAKRPIFIRDMYQIQMDDRVSLGWFGRLQTTTDDQGRSGLVNLKYGGTLPLVEGIRLLAMKHGIPATSTVQRMRSLAEKDVIKPDMHDYLSGAFDHITRLLLRQQITDFQAGREVGNFIVAASLSTRERDYLVACFRAVEDLRGRLKVEFSGQTL